MDILIGFFALLFFGGIFVLFALVIPIYLSTGEGRQDSDEEDWY